MENSDDLKTRQHLAEKIRGGNAFIPIEDVLEEITFEELGIRPQGLPYSFYEQFFHLRVSQYDILSFCSDKKYEAPIWPDDFWPLEVAPENEQEWEELKKGFFDEREAFTEFILDQANPLYKTLSNGDDETLMHEALLVLQHSAYHIGQMVAILRLVRTKEG